MHFIINTYILLPSHSFCYHHTPVYLVLLVSYNKAKTVVSEIVLYFHNQCFLQEFFFILFFFYREVLSTFCLFPLFCTSQQRSFSFLKIFLKICSQKWRTEILSQQCGDIKKCQGKIRLVIQRENILFTFPIDQRHHPFNG